ATLVLKSLMMPAGAGFLEARAAVVRAAKTARGLRKIFIVASYFVRSNFCPDQANIYGKNSNYNTNSDWRACPHYVFFRHRRMGQQHPRDPTSSLDLYNPLAMSVYLRLN